MPDFVTLPRQIASHIRDASDDESEFEEFLTEIESDLSSMQNSPDRVDFAAQCGSESDECFDEFISEVERKVLDCSTESPFRADSYASENDTPKVSNKCSLKIQLFPDEILSHVLSFTTIGKVCKRWSAIKVQLSRHRLIDLFSDTCFLPSSLARDIESELFLKCGQQVSKKYLSKGRSLAFNLRDNVDLLQRVLAGVIIPHQLVHMSADELARSELLAQRIGEFVTFLCLLMCESQRRRSSILNRLSERESIDI